MAVAMPARGFNATVGGILETSWRAADRAGIVGSSIDGYGARGASQTLPLFEKATRGRKTHDASMATVCNGA
jgi:hypothetical protein